MNTTTQAGTRAEDSTGPDRDPDSVCPRCRSGRTVSYGARCGCGHCGATWQAAR